MKRLLMILPLVLVLAACNLSQSADEGVDVETLEVVEPPTSTPPPAVNDDIFVQPTVDVEDDVDPVVPGAGSGDVATCTPRDDWAVTYTIQSGDTLSGIAQRTGTTTDALAAGNCLTDPNQIVLGGILRVPRQPDPAPVDFVGCSANVDFTVTGGVNAVSVTPSQEIDPTCFALTGGQTITVSWDNAPPTLQEVTFYRLNASLPRADVIGVDSDPSDGFAISWRVFDQMPPSVLFARGTGTSQGSMVESDYIGVYVE